jgi:hypothetical protein
VRGIHLDRHPHAGDLEEMFRILAVARVGGDAPGGRLPLPTPLDEAVEDGQGAVVEQVEDETLVLAKLRGVGLRPVRQPLAQLRSEPLDELGQLLDVRILFLDAGRLVPHRGDAREVAPQRAALVLDPLRQEGVAGRQGRHGPDHRSLGVAQKTHGSYIERTGPRIECPVRPRSEGPPTWLARTISY